MKQSPMKLSILIYSMSGGGAERVISYFLPFLHKKGVEVHLVLMNTTILFDVSTEIPIHYLEQSKSEERGILKLLKLPLLAFKYAKLLKNIGATHSFSLLSRPNYINLLVRQFSKHNCRFIISERNYPSGQYGHRDFKSKVNIRLIKNLYPSADLIICNSKESRLDLIANFACDENKIDVIYNPIDLEKIGNIAPVDDFFDTKFFNIISVGRLLPQKNQELLIRAVKKCKNVRLYILGQGALKKQLEKLILDLHLGDKVFLLGFDSNPYKYLKKADLFALGSNNEGFPNVLLEAMACGLPIISTNCKSGPSEMMELTEEKNDLMFTDYGILVPTNNVELMTNGIQYMLKNKDFLANCSTNALKRVQNFGKESILNKYLSALKNT